MTKLETEKLLLPYEKCCSNCRSLIKLQQLLLHPVPLLFQLGCMYRGEGPASPASFSSSWSAPESCLANPKYYSYIAVLALMATTMLVQVSHMVKLILMLLISVATGVINVYSWRDIFDGYDTARFQEYR